MSKKTETIEIRVSPEMKSALAETSSQADKSMSAYLRELVEDATKGGVSPSHTGDAAMAKTFPKPLTTFSIAALPVLCAAGLYLVGSTTSLTASPEFRMMFAEMDADNSGQISQAEFAQFYAAEMPPVENVPVPAACAEIGFDPNAADQASTSEEFGYYDTNADARVTYEELSAVLQRERVEMFLDVDANADGRVTVEELTTVEGEWSVEEEPDPKEAACFNALDAELEKLFPEDDMVDLAELDFTEEEIDPTTEARLFIAEFDSNRDGELTLTEVLEN